MPRTTPALLTVFALAAACAPPPPDAPAPPAAPGTAARVTAAPAAMGTIESVEYAGTGCEEGTTATGISDDKQAVTSTFSAFVASAGPTERSRAGHPQLHHHHAGQRAPGLVILARERAITAASSVWRRA